MGGETNGPASEDIARGREGVKVGLVSSNDFFERREGRSAPCGEPLRKLNMEN